MILENKTLNEKLLLVNAEKQTLAEQLSQVTEELNKVREENKSLNVKFTHEFHHNIDQVIVYVSSIRNANLSQLSIAAATRKILKLFCFTGVLTFNTLSVSQLIVIATNTTLHLFSTNTTRNGGQQYNPTKDSEASIKTKAQCE